MLEGRKGRGVRRSGREKRDSKVELSVAPVTPRDVYIDFKPETGSTSVFRGGVKLINGSSSRNVNYRKARPMLLERREVWSDGGEAEEGGGRATEQEG